MVPRMKRPILFCVLAVSGTVMVPSPTEAHISTGTGLTGCTDFNRTENNDHTFFYLSLNTENVTAFNNARSLRVNPTDINTSGTTQSSADVVVQDANYSTYCGYTWDTSATSAADGVVGLAKCNSIWTGPFTNFCNQHGVYVDTSFTTPNPSYRENLATHEIGHTLGLYHEADCVMTQGYPKPRSGYSLHSTGEINAAF